MKELTMDLDGSGKRIGLVLSRFNKDVGDGLLSSCMHELKRLGVEEGDITLATVPGALESPVILLKMAKSGKFDALIALGAVIRGETYHFEIVANESSRGVAEVQMETGVPVANAILTTEDDDQALARMAVKGAEAAQCAIEMTNLLRQL